MAYNYAAAFTQYAKGEPVEDISLALAIPLDQLKNKARSEGWARLASEMAVALVPAKRAERDVAKLEANRAKNLEIAQKLQQDLSNVVDKLLNGTLEFTVMTAKGEAVVIKPGIKDRKVLSEYAVNVAAMTYRALGDVEKPTHAHDGPGNAGGPMLIQINLPPPVAAPRQVRAEMPETVDVEALPRLSKYVTSEPVASEASSNSEQRPANTERNGP